MPWGGLETSEERSLRIATEQLARIEKSIDALPEILRSATVARASEKVTEAARKAAEQRQRIAEFLAETDDKVAV